MDRTDALALVRKYSEKDITYRHLISVEGVMRALARRFGEDEDRWGLTGLFHDLDYDRTEHDLDRHGHQTVEWLRAEGFDDEAVLNAILGHRFEEHRTDLMSKAIVHADAVAGLVVAAALVRPEKAHGMKVSSVKKKLKEKSFAPGVEREEIHGVEASIGLPLDEFLAVSIEGLGLVAGDIGLT
ncbi:MAG: HD domain-containing protein [Actinomycetota bacterium]